MTDLKTKILKKIREKPMLSLATITEDGKPWVRYVMGVVDDEMTIGIATSNTSRKAEQIRANPQVHVTCGTGALGDSDAYVQIQGKAVVHTDVETRKAFWNDNLKAYFSGPDDPGYAVVKISPYRIEYMQMTSHEAEVWEK